MNKTYLLFFCLIMIGCGQPGQVRHYTEVFSDPFQKKSFESSFSAMPQDDIHAGLMLDDTQQTSPLTWDTPKEWLEKKGSGLRLATFTGVQSKVETTIVSLGGSAGGVSANITRWMQQIGLDVPESEARDDFIKKQEKFLTRSGLPVAFIDLTELQEKDAGNAPSMIAAIIDRGDTQIFVKMTGTKEDVLKSRAVLKSFVQTIRLKE